MCWKMSYVGCPKGKGELLRTIPECSYLPLLPLPYPVNIPPVLTTFQFLKQPYSSCLERPPHFSSLSSFLLLENHRPNMKPLLLGKYQSRA